MVKAVCINSDNLILPKGGTLLSKGKFYTIIENIEDCMLVIIDDTGNLGSYNIERFILPEQIRQEKLEQLGIY